MEFIQAYINRSRSLELFKYRINWATHKDTLFMYMNYVGSEKWIKLEEAAKSFGYTFKPHSSLEDAKATAFLYNKLREEKLKEW